MPAKIKVTIVDDHEIFRNGLKNILSRMDNIELVGNYANGAAFIDSIPKNKADIVLMDIKMPGMDGIETTRKALEIKPDIYVIALSMFGDEEYLQDMIKAGVKGFLLKNITGKDLEHAIQVIFSGGNYYSEELLKFFTNKYLQDKHPEIDDIKITKRELEVLQLVAEGLSNQEIADRLFISKRTVDGHKNNLIAKTGSKNIVNLLMYSIKKGFVKISY
ncbi:MAG: response regulator transcription factor [Bacteroidales bacterium]|nr:response regulator transcription factor [Bacteroidales bacterium]MBN2764338.1 response regulator transcription factor [Bacteroidales bacterium]